MHPDVFLFHLFYLLCNNEEVMFILNYKIAQLHNYFDKRENIQRHKHSFGPDFILESCLDKTTL